MSHVVTNNEPFFRAHQGKCVFLSSFNLLHVARNYAFGRSLPWVCPVEAF